jgi:hypothetical protein
MTSLFTLASNDQSAVYLAQLFGSVGNVLQPMGSGTTVLNMMGTLFKTLNTTALIVGSLLVTYTTVVGLLKTAQEGEFLGKQWNSMWVPLRMVMGIAALFPTESGYSAIQIVFMWIIMQGVAAGDSLWTTAINFIQKNGSPYASVATISSVGIQTNIESLYQAVTCADAARRVDGSPLYPNSNGSTHSYYYCADHGAGASNADNFCSSTQTPVLSDVLKSSNPQQSFPSICSVSSDGSAGGTNNILTCNIGPNYNGTGACGSISLGNYAGIVNNCSGAQAAGVSSSSSTGQLQCVAYKAQQDELSQAILPTLEAMANKTNEFDHQYMIFYENKSPYVSSVSALTPEQKASMTPGSLPSQPPPAEDWIMRHCKDVGLKATDCCIYNNYTPLPPPVSCNKNNPCDSGTCSSNTTTSGTCSVTSKTTAAPTNCLTPDPNTGLFSKGFASDVNVMSGLTDYGNISKSAAQSLLLMCGVAPLYVSASTSTGTYSASGCMTHIAKATGTNPPTVCSSTVACASGGLCTSSSSTPGQCIFAQQGDFITGQVNNYNQALNTVTSALLAAQAAQQLASGENGNYDNMRNMGWMMAGGYYYQLAKQSNSDLQAANPPFIVTVQDPAMDDNSPLHGYRNNVQAAQYIIDRITGQSSSSLSGNAGASRIMSKQQQAQEGILSNFMGNLTGEANPLVGMQRAGEALIITGSVLFGVTLIVVALIAAFSNVTFIALGTGIPTNPAQAAFHYLGGTLFMGVMAFWGWCVVTGGFLSVYTPLIPYTIFTFGVIGWFFSVIEAMIASPFVALGILSPGGQHDLLGRAEPAMLLLANIFLRPTLMIMGMMTSMLFANIIVSIINSAFTGVMSDIYGSGTPDMISLILFIMAYTMLIISALNKTYSLIDIIPDRVLVWVGGQAGQGSGSAEGLSSMKGGVEAGGAAAAGAAKGAGDSAKGASDAATGKAKEKKKEDADAAKEAREEARSKK